VVLYIKVNMRRRDNQWTYSLKTKLPNGTYDEIDELNTLQDVADVINHYYFSDFQVISRSMVNNWCFNKESPRRAYAERFQIKKVEMINGTFLTNSYPISA